MDNLSNLTDITIIRKNKLTAAIGKINNKDAVYTAGGVIIDPILVKENHLIKSNSTINCSVKIQPKLIYPASKNHIKKITSKYYYHTESYNEYLNNDEFLKKNRLDNIINKNSKNELVNEKVYFENDDYIIIKDYKWDGKNNDYLYLLLIFKDEKYKSIREIDSVELLQRAKADILKICAEFGLSSDNLCLYFHYRPSYFRLHIHIVNISKTTRNLTCPTRNVYLDDVMINIKMDADYYKSDYYVGMENK